MAASVESPVSIPSGDTWTAYTFVDDPVMDDQFKHHLSMMLYGMSDLGECLEVGRHIVADDMESWIQAWSTMAQRLQTRAETFEAKGNRASAASSYLRAATYWRAGLMHFGPPSDPREQEHTKASYHCYDRYLELSGYPGEYVEVPYEGSVLPAYFYRSPNAEGPAPTMIFHQGRDAWPDDTRWVYDSAMQRGIHCLALHGPGQGLSIRLYGHPFRHDWEQAITPAVDRVLEIDGVDPDRIGLMGASFGGYLAPRAAAFEKRLTFCIANPGVLDWGGSIKAAFPPEILEAFDAGPEAVQRHHGDGDRAVGHPCLVHGGLDVEARGQQPVRPHEGVRGLRPHASRRPRSSARRWSWTGPRRPSRPARPGRSSTP